MVNIAVNGVRLAYDDLGTGPAVVFVHAGIADRRMWDDQFEALAATHRVVRYDWRGYGESGDARGRFAHYRDLLALLDALDIERATVVGASMGGAYAIDAALAAPHRVSGLVVLGSGLSGHVWPDAMLAAVREHVHSAVPAERLARYREGNAEHIDPGDVAAMALAQARFLVAGPGRDAKTVAPEVWERALAMLDGVFRRLWTAPPHEEETLDPPALGRLPELTVPLTVINGLADAPWIRKVAGLICAGVQQSRRIDLPGVGHLPSMERPSEVTAAILDTVGLATAQE
ncbi:alpha/beta hydrolase [Saccharomonospora xinjiangensis]|uniref:alpha/beta fold hydrolase n=1 Tax=Saccharomonospora xinjiangensis TaxID=75294 RepID=UPI00107061A6|nr:alpha/beta hydrolase [Saccharomonospora xinjiangensis]QBQ60933.1 Arylesterase [Saccharomonospora xinjiangensis]